MNTLIITRRNGDQFTVLFDEADRHVVEAHRWRVLPTRSPDRFYVQTTIGNTTKRLHQLLAGDGADHVNGNGLDNRRSNLRPSTHAQNMQNRRASRADGVKGVTWHRQAHKWQAQIAGTYLGLYSTKEAAARAYDAAAADLFGDFARLNGAVS